MVPSFSENQQSAAALRVERAIVELRRGRAIDVLDDSGGISVVAVERLAAHTRRDLRGNYDWLHLILTEERAQTLGLPGHADGILVRLPSDTPFDEVLGQAGVVAASDRSHPLAAGISPGDARTAAALALARYAQLIPALLLLRGGGSASGLEPLSVGIDDVADYPRMRSRGLQQVSRARVPLAASEVCEFIVYREPFYDAEHVAIIIGTPDGSEPIPVRLHSACLTGDLLASLRCDCGDQLRGAVERIAKAGGGVILYLAQEGRGIGLANKLRAYALQEQGLDTLQADRHLGFRADERDYTVACDILNDMGFERVILLTNNPDKMAGVDACAIEVVGRMPLSAPVNSHNARYLRTKREHAGHLPGERCAEAADEG
jgi:GTP cyclohydrolase II